MLYDNWSRLWEDLKMNCRTYEKLAIIFIGLTYLCLLFKIDVIFENFMASVFSLAAAVACRVYYTKKIEILCKVNPRTEKIGKNISQNIGMSYVGPIILGAPAIFFLIAGIYSH